jgi:outer membrane protein TolC
MLGFSEETGVAPDMRIDGIVDDVLLSCRKVATIDERPDVAAARANLEVAKRGLRNAWYGFLPTVGARATLGASSLVPVGYPSPTFSVEGLLSIPIWDGGARGGNIASLRADQDVAAQQLNALQKQGVIQVEQVKRQLLAAERAHAVARDQRDLAARSDDLTRAAYLAGEGTSFELVTASQAHRIAELNLVLREYGVIKARLAAALALATCYP